MWYYFSGGRKGVGSLYDSLKYDLETDIKDRLDELLKEIQLIMDRRRVKFRLFFLLPRIRFMLTKKIKNDIELFVSDIITKL